MTDSSRLHGPLLVVVAAAVLAFAYQLWSGAAVRGNEPADHARPPEQAAPASPPIVRK